MAKKQHFTGKYFVILLASTLIIAVLIAFNFIKSETFTTGGKSSELTQIKTQSSDTEINSIEKDLEDTDTQLGNLDTELQNIDTELNSNQ